MTLRGRSQTVTLLLPDDRLQRAEGKGHAHEAIPNGPEVAMARRFLSSQHHLRLRRWCIRLHGN